MKQVFILDAAEQAALAKGLSQVMRLADGSEFEFRFALNGTRPTPKAKPEPVEETPVSSVSPGYSRRPVRLKPLGPMPAKPDKLKVKCPKCALEIPRGPGVMAHVTRAHNMTLAQARKAVPPMTAAQVAARDRWRAATSKARRRQKILERRGEV